MKKLMTMLLAAMLVCQFSSDAFSWGGHHYHYKGGHYYREAWWGLGGFATGLAVGAYVASLPPRYDTVVISGVPYYYADGYYYQAGPSGYVIVAPPAGQTGQPAPSGGNGMLYVLGTLFGIALLLCIGVLFQKLLAGREKKSA